jgi:hypothetical protein
MDLRKKFLKQENTGQWWGGFKAVVSSSSSYASWVSMGMQAVVLYTVTSPTMNEKNIAIPFWVFCLVLGILAISILMFEWKVTIPSAVRFTNAQAYKHDNPIRTDLEHIKSDIELIKKKLGI